MPYWPLPGSSDHSFAKGHYFCTAEGGRRKALSLPLRGKDWAFLKEPEEQCLYPGAHKGMLPLGASLDHNRNSLEASSVAPAFYCGTGFLLWLPGEFLLC